MTDHNKILLDFVAAQNKKMMEQHWQFFVNEILPYVGEASMLRFLKAIESEDVAALGTEMLRMSIEASLIKALKGGA